MNSMLKIMLFSFIILNLNSVQAQDSGNLTQESLQACEDLEEGGLCSFTNDSGDSINGTCKYKTTVEGQLYCAPIH